MTQQDRHSVDMNTTQSKTPVVSGKMSPPLEPTTSPSCLLESLSDNGSLPEQRLLADILRRGGVLPKHELTALPNTNGNAHRPKAVFETDPDNLEPFALSSSHWPTLPELDSPQREAVARALHTPDVFLLQGLPGTGKSRVVTELVGLATERGDRVLLVAPSAETVHWGLEKLGVHPHVCAERWLGKREKLDDLPPQARAAVFEERVRTFHETTLPSARNHHQSLQKQLDKHRQDERIWQSLEQLLEQKRALDREPAHGKTEPDGESASADVRKQLETCRQEREATLAKIAQAEADLDTNRTVNREKREQLERETQTAKQLAEVRQAGQWWTLAWWRSFFQGDMPARIAQLEAESTKLQAEATQLDEEEARLQRDRQECDQTFERERLRLEEEETQRKSANHQKLQTELEQQSLTVQQNWHQLLEELSEPAHRPETCCADALCQARQAWQDHCEQVESKIDMASEWIAGLEEIEPVFADQLREMTNVVVAPLHAVVGGGKPPSDAEFDMLVLEEADRVREEDVLVLAALTKRLILVGEPESSSKKMGVFQRTWNKLHPDPRDLPYRWKQRFTGLFCTFEELPPEQAHWVVSERVADRPEIELRFFSNPGGAPRLVEVVFPAKTPIGEAKEYLFQELEELPLQGTCPSIHWVETDEYLMLQLSGSLEEGASRAQLSPGVTEWVVAKTPTGDTGGREQHWHTVAVQFDRVEGWNRDKAELWLSENLNMAMLGRTLMLRVPHRMHPALASWLSDVLFEGAYADSTSRASHGETPVSFVAVPSIGNRKSRGRSNSRGAHQNGKADTSLASLKGAGLECDLARPQRQDGLPRELRSALPSKGFINYEEAKAVVRYLEDSFDGKTSESSASSPAYPHVAVMALYDSQVELLRQLVARSNRLAKSALQIEVGLPSCFRQRECRIAVVSLTRSHTHRAVTFGSTPSLLTQALTLARERVILFGDAGTLIRRSHWEGPVDHLEAVEAQRERDLVSRLVHYLLGRGMHPKAFQLQKSCSV